VSHVTLLPPNAILGSKCTKNALAAGGAPDPAGELTALPKPSTPLAVFEGPLSGKEGEGKGGRGEKGKEGR